jgi:2-hydroxycyclohexanecarboxyl-CoA dehydrogenase
MKISGKTAVVTGGASGIGKATAEALAEAGAHVIIGDLDAANGEAVAASIRARGQGADYLRLDVADLASVAEFKAGALRPATPGRHRRQRRRLGQDPALHGEHAGVLAQGDGRQPARAGGRDSRLPARQDDRAQAGKVVTVSSDAGRVGSLGETVYSGAKGGAIAFTKSLAREVARYNINVNCVCPGPTDTPLLRAVPEKHQEAFVKATPMRRLAKPSEIADAILFFASDRASFITGQTISVSGGLTLAG